MARQRVEVRPGLVVKALQVGVAHQLEEVLVTLDVAGQEPQVEDAPALVAAALLLEAGALGKVELAPDEGLDAPALGRRVEVDGAKQVAMVRERKGAHPELARPFGQLVDPAGPVQQAVVRVDMEMDEVLVC